jgi:hypothetical protein
LVQKVKANGVAKWKEEERCPTDGNNGQLEEIAANSEVKILNYIKRDVKYACACRRKCERSFKEDLRKHHLRKNFEEGYKIAWYYSELEGIKMETARYLM